MKTFEQKHLLMKTFETPWSRSGEVTQGYPNVPLEEQRTINNVTKRETLPLKVETIQGRLTELKKANPEAYLMLEQSWVLNNAFENTAQLEKLGWYLKYLNYLYDVTRVSDLDPSETSQEISKKWKTQIVKIYKELLSEKTDFILNKEFLQYKFMEAIIRDIKRMWYFVQKTVDGNYVVKDFKTWKDVDKSVLWVYKDVFNIWDISNHSVDTALLSNIIVSNPEFETIMTQKEFINSLLTKYWIVPNVKDKDKTKYLIVNWEQIKKQIKEKISFSKSWQEISELSLLQNFVENELWTDASSYDRFNKANTYAKGFLTEKAFIDAYKSWKLPGLNNPDQSVEKQIASVVKNAQIPAAIFGIVAWLMWFKKTGLWAIWFWLFWWMGADLLSDWIKTSKSVIGWGEQKIDPIEKDQVWVDLKNSQYQDKYQELVVFNAQVNNWDLQKSGWIYISNNYEQLNPNKLNRFIKHIILKGIDINLSDFNAAEQLNDAISGSNLEEIEALVNLMNNSWIKEEWDETTLDFLTKGWKDTLNRPFDSIYPTKVPEFDEKITKVLIEEYNDKKTSREQKYKIIALKKKIASEFWAIINIGNAAKDKIHWTNTSSKTIDIVLSYVKIAYPSLETSLESIFVDYKKYNKAKNELAGFEWLYDENISNLLMSVQSIFKTVDYLDTFNKTNEKIAKLENITISEPLSTESPFKELNSKISTLINKLKESNKKLLEKAEKEWINLDNNWAKDSKKQFENNTEILDRNILDGINAIKKAIDSLTKEESLKKINNILNWISNDYKQLIIVETALSWISISSSNKMKILLQRSIIENLAQFTAKKVELEKIVRSSLEEFYKRNNVAFNEISAISTTDIETAILQLANIKESLAENDIFVWVEEEIKEVINEVNVQLPKQKNSDVIPQGVFGKIEKIFRDFVNKINNSAAEVSDSIIGTYNKSKAKLEEQIALLKKYATDKGISELDTTKLTTKLENLFKARDKDSDAQRALNKAKEIFWVSFEITDWTNSIEWNTVEKVQNVYNDKISELNTFVKTYIQTLVPETSVKGLKKQTKILETIRKNFGIDSEIIGLVEKKQDALLRVFIGIENADNPVFKSLLSKDLAEIWKFRDSSNTQEIKDVFINLFDWVNSIDLSNTTIETVLLEAVKISKELVQTKDENWILIFKDSNVNTKDKFYYKFFFNITSYNI